MNNKTSLILLGSQKILNKTQLNDFKKLLNDTKDWDKLFSLLQKNHVSGLFYKNCLKISNQQAIPSEFLSKLKKEYIFTFVSNTKINHDFKRLNNLLKQSKIDTIPLKGMYNKEKIYKDIGLRKIADIDLLVKENDLVSIKELMLKEDWKLIETKKRNSVHEILAKQIAHHPLVFRKDNLTIEFHIGIHKKHLSFKVSIEDFWLRAKYSNFIGEEFLTLDSTDLLLHLCLHAKKDLFHNAIKLKSLIDIAELLKTSQHEINFDLLWENGKKYNCTNELEQILMLINSYFSLELNFEFQKNNNNKSIDPIYKILFENIFDKNYKARISYLIINHFDKINIQILLPNKILKFKFWLGYVFPNQEFVKFKYYQENRKKSLFKFYRFLRLIRT